MKKAFLVAGIGLLIIIVFIGFFILTQNNSSNKIPSQSGLSVTFPPKGELTDSTAARKYEGANFTAVFPENWEAVTGFFQGGEDIAFRPQGLPAGDFIPSVQVVVFNSGTDELLAQQRAQYDTAGYSMQQDMLDGNAAIKLSGVYSFYTKKGRVVNEPLQNTVYFLQKNGKLFVIQYKYAGDKKASEAESLLSGIVESMEFK